MATVQTVQDRDSSTTTIPGGPGAMAGGGLNLAALAPAGASGLDLSAFGGLLQSVMARKQAREDEERARRLEADEVRRKEYAEMVRQRTEDRRAAYDAKQPSGMLGHAPVAVNQAYGNPRPQIGGGFAGALNNEARQDPLSHLRQAVEADELQAALSGPVQRHVTGGPGIIGGGQVLDPSRMNAAQRKLYLPNDSRNIVPPAASTVGQEAEEMQAGNRARAADPFGQLGMEEEETAPAGAGRQARGTVVRRMARGVPTIRGLSTDQVGGYTNPRAALGY